MIMVHYPFIFFQYLLGLRPEKYTPHKKKFERMNVNSWKYIYSFIYLNFLFTVMFFDVVIIDFIERVCGNSRKGDEFARIIMRIINLEKFSSVKSISFFLFLLLLSTCVVDHKMNKKKSWSKTTWNDHKEDGDGKMEEALKDMIRIDKHM